MCTINDLKNEIDSIKSDLTLYRSWLNYIRDDVGYLKEKTKEQIKFNNSLQKRLMEREQFFIDAVVDMKELIAKMDTHGKAS